MKYRLLAEAYEESCKRRRSEALLPLARLLAAADKWK
jgi:hypothetical protein